MAGQARQGSWPASATAAGCCSRLCVARRDSLTAASVQYHFSTHCWVACVYHTRLVLLLLHPDIYIQQCPVRAFVVWRDTCILFRVLWFGIVYRIVQDQVLPRYKIGLGGGGKNVKGKNFERRAALELCSWPACPSKTHKATGLASTTAAVCWKLRDHVHLGVVTCLGHRFSRARGLEIYCTLLYGCDDEKTHSAGPRALR